MADGATSTGPNGQEPSKPISFFQKCPRSYLICPRTLRKTPLAVLKLLRTSTNIVTRSKTQNMVHGLGLRNVTTGLANDKRQFRFVVTGSVLGDLGHIDLGRVGTVQCSPGLDEENGHVRDGHVGFPGVVAVVKTHASDDGDILYLDWGQKLNKLVSKGNKSGCFVDLPEQPVAAFPSLYHQR